MLYLNVQTFNSFLKSFIYPLDFETIRFAIIFILPYSLFFLHICRTLTSVFLFLPIGLSKNNITSLTVSLLIVKKKISKIKTSQKSYIYQITDPIHFSKIEILK